MRTWKRDIDNEEGGSHRTYVADDGWIAERRSNDAGGGHYWQVTRSENDYWEITTFDTLAEAKAWIEKENAR